MVWPILISVSVIPGAFSARAGHALVAKAAAAAMLDCRNMRRVVMSFLLFAACDFSVLLSSSPQEQGDAAPLPALTGRAKIVRFSPATNLRTAPNSRR